MLRNKEQVADEFVAKANSKKERSKVFRAEVMGDLDEIENLVGHLKEKLTANCKTDENPEGLLALEKSQYLANFEIKRNELMSMIDKDLALWEKNFAQVEKMKDMMSKQLASMIERHELEFTSWISNDPLVPMKLPPFVADPDAEGKDPDFEWPDRH